MTRMVALHGFLGSPDDFKGLIESNLDAINLIQEKRPFESMENFAKRVCKRFDGNQNILLGYSLGGRVALHLLFENPSLWKAAVFVSTNPGLNHDAINLRWQNDLTWAKAFNTLPWNDVLKAWNQQAVFKNSHVLCRKAPGDSQKTLAQMLLDWSLAKQKKFTEKLKGVNLPILWIVGANDRLFIKSAKELSWQHPQSKTEIIQGAGHRVLWDNPKLFKTKLNDFLRSL